MSERDDGLSLDPQPTDAAPKEETSRTAAKAEKRGENRYEIGEGTILIDGKGYPLENLSGFGFSAMSYEGNRKQGEEFEISYLLHIDRKPLQIRCVAMVVWVDVDRRKIGGLVVKMEEESRHELSQHFLGIPAAT